MKSFITVGLMFGDEGKGTVVDALVRKHNASVVIRYNGGAQAAHNVVGPDGRHHTFAQFGSGTFVPGVKTFLSRFMLVNPLAMQMEARNLEKIGVKDALARMVVDRRALVTTPYHRATNRLREMSRKLNRHGSCGMGIGETAQDAIERGEEAIRVGDIKDQNKFRKKLYATHAVMREKIRRLQITESIENPEVSETVRAELSTFDVDMNTIFERYQDWNSRVATYDEQAARIFLGSQETVVFEGAQGVLLDENRGFHPYTTWSTTTSQNAYSILADLNIFSDMHEIGVVRPYVTRHGLGPFVTEDELVRRAAEDDHNKFGDWQREFRVGWFDAVMLDYALKINGPVDSIAITHTDKLGMLPSWKMCVDYGFGFTPGTDLREQEKVTNLIMQAAQPVYELIGADRVTTWIAERAKAPISVISFGPRSLDKCFK
jgi:adenylosuccinate synthase